VLTSTAHLELENSDGAKIYFGHALAQSKQSHQRISNDLSFVSTSTTVTAVLTANSHIAAATYQIRLRISIAHCISHILYNWLGHAPSKLPPPLEISGPHQKHGFLAPSDPITERHLERF